MNRMSLVSQDVGPVRAPRRVRSKACVSLDRLRAKFTKQDIGAVWLGTEGVANYVRWYEANKPRKPGNVSLIRKDERAPFCPENCQLVLTKEHPASRIRLLGKEFGQLRVLEYVGIKDRRSVWKCQCSCGNVTLARGDKLKQFEVISCGCAKQARLVTHGLAGIPTYARLRRLRAEFSERQISKVWRGTEGVTNFVRWYEANKPPNTPRVSLLRKDERAPFSPANCRLIPTRELPSASRLALAGKTFGWLKVLKFVRIEKQATLWRCRCRCGNEVDVVGHFLTAGTRTSCGCKRGKKRPGEARPKKQPIDQRALRSTLFTHEEVMQIIQQRIEREFFGSRAAFARHLGVTKSAVSDCFYGRRRPMKLMLKEVGLKRVAVYRTDGSATILSVEDAKEFVIEKIERECKGDRRAFARAAGLDYKAFCNIFARKARPGRELLEHLDLQRTFAYQRCTRG